jgi:hypothetical protein
MLVPIRAALATLSLAAIQTTAPVTAAHATPQPARQSAQPDKVTDTDIAVLARAMLPIAGEDLSQEDRQVASRTFQSIGPFPLMWGGWIASEKTVDLVGAMLAMSEDQKKAISGSLGAKLRAVRKDLVIAMREELSAALRATRASTVAIGDPTRRTASAKEVSAATARISKLLADASSQVEATILAESPILSAQQELLLPIVAAVMRQETLIISFSYHFPGLRAQPLQSAMSQKSWGFGEPDLAIISYLSEILRLSIEERGADVRSFESAYIDHFSVATLAEVEMALQVADPDQSTKTRYESTRRRLPAAARRVSDRNLDMCIALATIGDGIGPTSGFRLWAQASPDVDQIVQDDWISFLKSAYRLHESGAFTGDQYDEFEAFVTVSEDALASLVSAYLDEVQKFQGTGSYGRQQRAQVGPRLGELYERFDRARVNAALAADAWLETARENVVDTDTSRVMRDTAIELSRLLQTRSLEGFYESSPWITQVPR